MKLYTVHATQLNWRFSSLQLSSILSFSARLNSNAFRLAAFRPIKL